MRPIENGDFPTPTLFETVSDYSRWMGLEKNITGGSSFGVKHSASALARANGLAIAAASGYVDPRSDVTVSGTVQLRSSAAQKIIQTSANSVFASDPIVSVPHEATQELVDNIQDGHFWQVIHQAEQDVSLLGGVYLVPEWDTELLDYVGVKAVSSNVAEPTFRSGVLVAVSFYHVLRPLTVGGSEVYRLVESHLLEDASEGDGYSGVIVYELFNGSANNVGARVPLDAHPDSAYLLDGEDLRMEKNALVIETGLDRLDVIYVRNVKKNNLWAGANASCLGVSDLRGVEGTIAELDSWLTLRSEEARINRTRLVVDENALDVEPDSMRRSADLDRTVYSPMRASGMSPNDGGRETVQVVQGIMRNEQFRMSIDDCWNRIASLTGFSAASFGVSESKGIDYTATGVRAKMGTTNQTVLSKQQVWRNALRDLFKLLLLIQSEVYGNVVVVDGLDVSFPRGDASDSTEHTQNILSQFQSGLMSVETAVASLHPDWDEAQVAAEIARLGRAVSIADTADTVDEPVRENVDADIDGMERVGDDQ